MTHEKLDITQAQEQEQPNKTNFPLLTEAKLHEEKKLSELERMILEENKEMRKKLIFRLQIISIIWLTFTGLTITLLGFGNCVGYSYHLSDSVTIAFITTSFGTVLGLWAIGLRYFFAITRTPKN
ncbi:MAG: hypothetical protein LBE12_15385 [Planctomycetaceae bacterium]|jgi:hypothetical protein|nr:hypothetical protein [Planctomycetaceae bacterium]